MYDAIDIAEYILCYCEKKLKKPLTNLQLQKILYYIQGRHVAKIGEPIFDNKIEAWKYGPVIPDVYFWFNDYMSEPITGVECSEEIELSKDSKKIIETVISEKINFSPWRLVEETHKEKPWVDNYSENMNFEINIEDLRRYFKEN